MKDKEVDGVLNGAISDPERKCLAIFSCSCISCQEVDVVYVKLCHI